MSEIKAILYLLACPVSWYLLTAADYGLNSSQLGRHPYLFPFQCFAEEFKCHWFGGWKYRVEFIRSRSGGEGWFCGYKRSYSHKEIRENDLYEEVFLAMCGGRISFWGKQIVYLFLGPFLITALLIGLAGGAVIGIILWPIEKMLGIHR